MDKYTEWEIINIPAGDAKLTDIKFTVSDWGVYVDGITKTAWEVNSKTGERREISYQAAMGVLFGRHQPE